jgi:hypothetical protein
MPAGDFKPKKLPKEEFSDHLSKVEQMKKLNTPKRQGRFEEWEVAFIKANYKNRTDVWLAEQLFRDVDAVTLKRQTLKLKKPLGSRPKDAERHSPQTLAKKFKEQNKNEYEDLTPAQKRSIFENQFKHTRRYKELQDVLTAQEIDTYAEKWMDYISTWETVLATEEDTLHLAILELIRAHRTLVRQKAAMDNPNGSPVPIEAYEKNYKEIVENYNKMMQQLSGTRLQRLATNKEEKMTLVTMVQSLQDAEIRKRAGDEAATIQAAAGMTKNWMRQQNFLMDGQ